jgi:tRNA-dihydrouridine synthase A
MILPYRKVSIAPMMDWTNRHFRYFIRLITKYVNLYTEMISEHAIYYKRNSQKDLKHLLDYDSCEHPLIFQIGGSHIPIIKECVKIVEEWNYDGININCGCPSEKVFENQFGAILMAKPRFIANIVKEIKKVSKLPVSIKHRLGIKSNHLDKTHYEDLKEFIKICYNEGGCEHFIIHARHAYLGKYSPKKNRVVPPLIYEWVYQIKEEFPELMIEINGGIDNIQDILNHLKYVDAVMIGRAAYEDPYFLIDIDEVFLNQKNSLSRKEIFLKFVSYVLDQIDQGIYPHSVVIHTFGLFRGIKNSNKWKQYLTKELTNLKKYPIEKLPKELVYDILTKSLEILPEPIYEANRHTIVL